ncbi:F-box associated domain type 3 [Arabidopsis thaliana x Arabidopsis arenosa]|uniref:F-box associated domain type 3 n=1 Tax=Arabidopsis thaliana x Arabidopsis arenosa TaxID=1240361 RepID=A0A8T1ZPL4_9BRAS|nr:F-box associated domain type 3 [Arabidopsis thaliana x Arabidopsis arenosa]
MGSSLSLAVRKKKEKKTLVVLPEITEEMLIDILIRLPAKSLMRFKCVSKLWLSLITSRYFANRFLIKPSPSRCFFAYLVDCENQRKCLLLKSSSSSHDHSDTSVSVIDQHSTMTVMGGYFVNSVRGLLCYRTRRRVKVCNPNTRQVLSLVWEVNKEERVVRSEHKVLVLGDGATWRNTQSHNDTPHGPFYPHSQGMTINGVLYYIAWTDEDRCVLMSFDLSSEEFNLIELLPYENFSCTSLINYQGKVATCEDSLLSSDGIVDVCVLEDADKSKWSNKKTFLLPVSQMNFVHGDRLVIGGTRDSGKVLLT